MCDIDAISKEKDELVEDITQVATMSEATIIKVKEEMREIERKAKRNIERLSLLL